MDGSCNVLVRLVQDRHSCLDRLRYISQRDLFGCLGLLSCLHLALLPSLRFPIALGRRDMLSCFPDMYSMILAPTDRAAAARFFRVLGDPTRLHILELLEEKERTVGERGGSTSAQGQHPPSLSAALRFRRHRTPRQRGGLPPCLARLGSDR